MAIVQFTFLHLADAFIQIEIDSGHTFFLQYTCSLGIEPITFALLTQCSTTESQEHCYYLLFQMVIRSNYISPKVKETELLNERSHFC